MKEPSEIDLANLKKLLIEIYTKYLDDPANPNVKRVAQTMNSKYRNADDLLPASFNKAINNLLHLSVDKLKTPSEGEIEQLLKELKKEKVS